MSNLKIMFGFKLWLGKVGRLVVMVGIQFIDEWSVRSFGEQALFIQQSQYTQLLQR